MLKGNPFIYSTDLYSQPSIYSLSEDARLLELNFRTLLDELPAGKQFYVAGNGRVRRRPSPDPGTVTETSGEGGTRRRTDI